MALLPLWMALQQSQISLCLSCLVQETEPGASHVPALKLELRAQDHPSETDNQS